MSELKEYKCPACGGIMEFDSASQKMKCPYCDTELDVSAFEEPVQEQPAGGNPAQPQWSSESADQWTAGDGMRIYECESCGGEIVADENTGATACPFCGSKVVMKGQFSGDLKPDYIIPFKLDKKAAKEAYRKHLNGKPFLPKVFKDENHIDEIKGVYVPFWLFDMNADADVNYKAQNVRVWSDSSTEYTEVDTYSCHRAGSLGFDRLPCDASKKMDDTLMEAIEPFRFDDAVPFKSAYMAGYVADRYDVDMDSRKQRAAERAQRSAEISLTKTVSGYDTVTPNGSSVNIRDAHYFYALYPVWILNSTWHDKKFTFAMNGQTGKLVGDLPLDKGAFWKYVAGRTGIYAAVIYALIWAFMTFV